MSNEEIGFGKNISGTLGLFPSRKPILSVEDRKKKILLDETNGDFKISQNSKAKGNKPWYAIDGFSEVKKNKDIIEKESKAASLNPELVKAIIHLETTQGAYDKLIPFDKNKTIRPMNIHSEYWKELGYSRDELKTPETNIHAGVKLLKRIKQNMPYASDEEIASVYNNLDARYVTDYGMRVKRLIKERPWETE